MVYEKITKCPNFTWNFPENWQNSLNLGYRYMILARKFPNLYFYMTFARKVFSRNWTREMGVTCPPPCSPSPTLWVSYFSWVFGIKNEIKLFLAKNMKIRKRIYCKRVCEAWRQCNAQYTPPTPKRCNCRVESRRRRRCVLGFVMETRKIAVSLRCQAARWLACQAPPYIQCQHDTVPLTYDGTELVVSTLFHG